MEYADPEVNEFFTSPEYLKVVTLLNLFNEGCESTLADFFKGFATDNSEYKQI
jgi:hypothetical protein